MFKKKSQAEVTPAESPVHEDLIIHNMPSPSRLAGSGSGTSFSAGFETGDQPAGQSARNFKITGLLIMAGGLVFIGALVYLSFRFIIRPVAEPVPPAIVIDQNGTGPDSVGATVTPPVIIIDTASSTDLSGETPLEVTPAEPEAEEATTTPISEPATPPIADSDSDGLGDSEETIFATNPLLADTDGDGYSDSVELTGGYDPLSDGRLSVDVWARTTNQTFGYEVSHPASWAKQTLNSEATFLLTAPDESLIQISAAENIDKASILTWYEEAFPGSELSYSRLESGAGWEGIIGEDGLNFYLTDDNHGRILVVSYISAAERPAYPFIFELIINSLALR